MSRNELGRTPKKRTSLAEQANRNIDIVHVDNHYSLTVYLAYAGDSLHQ